MAFKTEKMRPDFRTKNRVIPITKIDLPEEFWTEAKTYRNSWNEIVAEFLAFDYEHAALLDRFKELKKENADLTGIISELKTLKEQRREAVKAKWKQQSPVLFNNDLEVMQEGVDRSLKAESFRFKRGLDSINFTKRYGKGGVKFEELFTLEDSRSDKLKRKPFAVRTGVKRDSKRSEMKTPLHGTFLIGKNRVRVGFYGLWTYPDFLEGCFIKRVSLNGKKEFNGRKWYLTISAEMPPVKNIVNEALPVAGLDLGYRVFSDYIRFGVVSDSAGNSFELRLPFGNMMTQYLRRKIEFVKKKFNTDKDFVKDLYDYFAWDSAQGKTLEATKQKVKTIFEKAVSEISDLPGDYKDVFAGLVKMRNHGLLKIKRICGSLIDSMENDANQELLIILTETSRIIEEWKAKDIYYEKEKYLFRKKFIGRRQKLYRNVAIWLSQNYSQVIFEKDMKLAEIATKAKKSSRVTDAALLESNKFRQWTSLSELIRYLEEKAQDFDNEWLTAGKTAYSSYFCHICKGKRANNPEELISICVNGHRRDQDVKASRNLLSEAEIKPGDNNVKIPEHLESNIIRITEN